MKFRVIDASLHLAHMALMGFSAFGWIAPQTRPWHLVVQALVGLSWFGFGAWRGWGYCWLTDLQWRFKASHGQRPATASFVEHWTNDILGLRLSSTLVQAVILWTWVATTLVGIALWVVPS